ncbi:DUF262 domain-containing protein [Paenibacillus sp. IHBB 10380]|uniref:DUF262 domain-containing protein n=1 Tax=Paenibacillus sp. IHBB 10380 TaxID=1566358 RepID=UPI0005CFEEBD|nr:DUF262 domain-containing protein [Paenibacillus sp. IHBB 10380]AJS58986.1 hypothetical protein UB51_11470 [Paenibacillus sp. IHBB 10380]
MKVRELELKQLSLEDEITDARNNLTTDRLDMSYGEIMSMYERGEIIISPEFQRLFRWSDFQKTRFVESILLGIPTPPIFVAEDTEGRWELVDGLQRISTILSFFGELKKDIDKNNWILDEGSLIKNFEGFTYKELPLKFQRNIKRTYCRVEILKWDSKLDMRYELFNRLNTGGASLTEQEIRNCIFRGISSEFNDYLDRVSKYPKFVELINASGQKESEGYLQELVLRITSLFNYDWNNVSTKNMSKFMTKFMEEAVTEGFDNDFEKLVYKTIDVLHPLGSGIFRFSNNQLSTSLVDAIFIGIAMNIEHYESVDSVDLMSKIESLKEDSIFRSYTGSAASSKSRVIKRMDRAKDLFSEY